MRPFHVFGTSSEAILAECKQCGRVLRLPVESCTKVSNDYIAHPPLRCHCGNVGTDIVSDLPAKPRDTEQVDLVQHKEVNSFRSFSQNKAFYILCGILVILAVIISHPGIEPNSTAIVSSTPAPQTRTVCLAKEDQQFARDALRTVTEGASPEVSFQDAKGTTKVVFSDKYWAAASPRPNIQVIADADACIHGTARRLDFYRANGDHVGYADPQDGIKVLAY